jgi:hypothetical protein
LGFKGSNATERVPSAESRRQLAPLSRDTIRPALVPAYTTSGRPGSDRTT